MNKRILIIIVVIILIIIGLKIAFTNKGGLPDIPANIPVTNPDKGISTSTSTSTIDGMESMNMSTGTQSTTVPVKSSSQNTVSVPSKLPATVKSTVREFNVTGKNYSFAPATITVKKGETVKINFLSGGGFHDFKIDEFVVATKRLRDTETDSVTFVANKTGSFEYYCSVGSHRSMGMKGTLIVQ